MGHIQESSFLPISCLLGSPWVLWLLWSGSVRCFCSGKWTESIISAVNTVCQTQHSSLAGVWQVSRFHVIYWLQTIYSINLFEICICQHLDCLIVSEIPMWGWQMQQRTSGRSTFSGMVAAGQEKNTSNTTVCLHFGNWLCVWISTDQKWSSQVDIYIAALQSLAVWRKGNSILSINIAKEWFSCLKLGIADPMRYLYKLCSPTS